MSCVRPQGTIAGSAFDRYEKVAEIGRGNFSTVYKARLRNPAAAHPIPGGAAFVAIKSAPTADIAKLQVLRKEWTALSASSHPAVVPAYEYYENSEEASMVLEYAEHGSLMTWLHDRPHGITERQARVILTQLLQALHYIHSNEYAHRDVKPHNVLVVQLSPLVIRLADFGLVKRCSGWARQCSAGDWECMAPELKDNMMERLPVSAEELQKNDIFSAGTLLYYLLSGTAPFPAGLDCRSHVPSRGWNFPKASPEAIELTQLLMNSYVGHRPDAQEALLHPWFSPMDRFGSGEASSEALGAPSAPGSSTPRPAAGISPSDMSSPLSGGCDEEGSASPLFFGHEAEPEKSFDNTETVCCPSGDDEDSSAD